MKVKEESEKFGSKLSIQKTKIMASGPITSWQIDGKTMLSLWKKSYDQPRQLIKKQRHHFANKRPSSQSYGFSSIMYGCELGYKESWVLKN